jgi:hypothetical protein
MSAARLTQVRLRRLKSIGAEEQTVELRPLTAMIGRNSSGKSTVIQSLLLLKQTLEDPRPEVQLSLQGIYLRATSLRELTHGWPDDVRSDGPEITLQWTSSVNGRLYDRLLEERSSLAGTRLAWLVSDDMLDRLREGFEQTTEISLSITEADGILVLPQLRANWPGVSTVETAMRADMDLGGPILSWADGAGTSPIRMDHFLPYLSPVDQDWELLPEDITLRFAFGALYAEPLRALKGLLTGLSFVGASRDEVPPYYAKPVGPPGRMVLPGGGNAPELLYSRQAERVHCAPPAGIGQGGHLSLPEHIAERSMKDAVQEILAHLGIDSRLSFQDVQEIGVFRLLFGRAPLNHIGRGVGHVLPVIVANLLGDPLLGQRLGDSPEVPRDEYLERCPITPCLAHEELESHLHPKAQSRLAEVMVALARSGRQLLVETHSDHLVRRLRSLTAHTEPGSASERWLLENVGLVEVEQGADGVTRLTKGQLTREGSIERWPADFMDEATDEERSIYFAGTAKLPPEPVPSDEWLLRDVPPTGGGES